MVTEIKTFLIRPERNYCLKSLSLNQFLLLILFQFSIIIVLLALEGLLFGITPNKFVADFEEVNRNIILFMILGSVVFPVLEEFLHRYYLNYRNRNILTSSFLLLLYFFVEYDKLDPVQNIIHFLAFLFLIAILLLKMRFHYINLQILAWGSIVFFGLFHLSTYERDVYIDNYLMIPVLVSPQIIGGLFLAFIRINYGFMHGILFHGFFNFLLLALGATVYQLFYP